MQSTPKSSIRPGISPEQWKSINEALTKAFAGNNRMSRRAVKRQLAGFKETRMMTIEEFEKVFIEDIVFSNVDGRLVGYVDVRFGKRR